MKPLPLSLLPLGLVLLAAGCRTERTEGRQRKPIAVPAGQEWVRLALDAEAQRAFPAVWIGDAKGQPVPFEVERDTLWTTRPIEVTRLSLGQDPQNRPTAELSLRLPAGWKPGEREYLRIDLDMEGISPWACAVRLQHRAESQFLELNPDVPFHVHDLGLQGSHKTLLVPWDATEYRLLFQPLQGAAPRLRNVTVTAITAPPPPPREERLTAKVTTVPAQGGAGEVHLLALAQPDRVGALEADLDPGLQPVKPSLVVTKDPLSGAPRAEPADETWPFPRLLWNIPREGTRCQRAEFPPVTVRQFRVTLPAGAQLKRIRLLPRRNVLLFQAAPGTPYFLHLRSAPPKAPGVCRLPDGSRIVYAQEPIHPGPAEPDPAWRALPPIPDWREGLRSRWAWGLGLLGAAALLVFWLKRRG